MKYGDLISSLFWTGVGVTFCVAAKGLGLFANHIPGAGFFPFIMSIILVILSIMVLISAIKKREEIIKEAFSPEKESLKKVSFSLLALFGYVLALEYLGYLFTTFLFMIFLLRFIEPQRWINSVIVAFLTIASSYIIFVIFLNIRLPKGIFGM